MPSSQSQKPNLTRQDLARAIAQQLNIPQTQAARLLESFVAEISDCLAHGESVKLSSFGSFHLRNKPARTGRNPKTGEKVAIAPQKSLVFKASQSLKRNINGA